jgi:dihydroflavonol-4-reductase
MTKTAFVTGATGFLGTNLVKQLVLLGWQVSALKRANSDTQEFCGINVTWHDGDITLKKSVIHACPENVDAFFHVAADTNLWRKKNAQQNSVNLTGTENAIDAAITKYAKRFIHTSSIAAFGVHLSTIDENSEQKGDHSFCNYYRTKYTLNNNHNGRREK